MDKKIAVLTDSTAYIPQDLIKKYDIHVIPLLVNWGEESYLDNVEITPEIFYERLTADSVLPTTSQPSAGAFKEIFDELSGAYDGVVAVLLSSHLSGTVDSAITAKEMMSGFKVEIVDSELTTMALGLMVIEAAKVAQSGCGISEVAEAAKKLIGKMRVMFVVDTLEFLHKGGRIGGAKRLMGSMLAMKPLLELKDGRITPLDSVRTKKKAIQTMLGHFYEDANDKSNIHLTVYHGVAGEDAEYVLSQAKEKFALESSIIAKLSPVIGVHTGPGTVGMAYYFD